MVFEEQVAYYLDRYLGKFVKGLSKEALKISVWAGNVELTNMELKPEALNALKLPIKVKAGFLGSVKLKVPWSRLGQEPVVVYLDRIFLLAEPATDVDRGDSGDAVQEAKMKRVTESERKMMEIKSDKAVKEEVNNSSWIGSLIGTIIGNLKLTISNIHVRYEDGESHPGHPFSAGMTLEKLAAVTVDDNGKETFVTGGSLDQIQKACELQRLAVYFDPDSKPWNADKKWEKLRPEEWAEIFCPGIKAKESKPEQEKLRNPAHAYVLQPVGGNARYYKLANKAQRTPDTPAQRATVLLDDVTVALSEGQYRDALKLVENFSTFNKRLEYAHYRPSVSVKEDTRAWWQYAFKSVAEQIKQASGHVSWKRIVKLSAMRKQYVSLYVSSLQSGSPDRISVDDNKEIRLLDRELDTDVIIQFRMMAHTYVDRNREMDRKRQNQGGWWPFGWGGQASEEDKEAKFSQEDLEKFNELIGYQEGQQSNMLRGEDPPNMLHTLLDVRMRHNATKLVGEDNEELLELSADDLRCVLHMYPKTMKFDVNLGRYQIACPEGLLGESATKADSITATFIYLPTEMEPDGSVDKAQKLDWSLSAKAKPCYVTVLMQSINKVLHFFQSSKAVSRSVALDTATALQTTLDEVTRNAQQQINEALKDRPRFSIDLDLAAPKVTIPTDFYPDGVNQCKLLVDLGYFSLQTELDDKASESAEENELYMRFRMQLTDVSAILVDGEHDWSKDFDNDISNRLTDAKTSEKREMYLPVVEKCGMLVAVQQICVPHPLFPTTRVALRLPKLGFHFSPARYHRLMRIMEVFQNSSSDDEDDAIRPWEPSDFDGKVSVLAWKGVGHREAVWQRRHAALTGPFLYLLETADAQTYKTLSSLIGKQVYNVPPESVGDVPFVLAVCDAGQFNNKVAESVNALLMRFEDESHMNNWQSRLTGAIYRISAPAAIGSIVGSKGVDDDPKDAIKEAAGPNQKLTSAEQESIFLIGVLEDFNIVISNNLQSGDDFKQILLDPESPLLEFRAIGTKVELSVRTYDMSVGAVLQTLEIEDKYYGHISPSCRYLARSYIKKDKFTGTARSSISRSSHHQRLHKRKVSSQHGRKNQKEKLSTSKDDRFFDAADELDSEGLSVEKAQQASNNELSNFFDVEADETDGPPTFQRTTGLLPATGTSKGEDVVEDNVLKNFVKVQVTVCSQDSPQYTNIDKRVEVNLATLSFFTNRRTLLALLDLSTAISAEDKSNDPNTEPSSTETDDAIVSSIDSKAIDEKDEGDETNASFQRNDSVVKGLLGKGKSRLVFLVVLNMDRAQIVLNAEDGAQLSTLSLEDLHTEVKVFPASFGIKAGLGNLRISDGSLEESHSYYYICDMRDPNGASFIELEFLSFNDDDEDYEGFEYSVMGKLSEVRIVFLNRFIQEIVSYFMGLVPKNSGYVVKLKDRVTDVEKFFDQSEIEGQPGMKLALSLTKPVIIMPRSTKSNDFLELDILHINLSNSFQWLGGDKDTLGAVRLETTVLELEDLHLVVGVDGKTGEGIIQEARGLSLVVRRPIRDIWHQLPAAEASISIKELRAALSDKEYQVITECAISNLAETPNLPPPVIESPPEEEESKDHHEVKTSLPSGDQHQNQQPTVDNESNEGNAWTTVKVGIGIQMVELGLFTGHTREAPLASIQVAGVWASYKSNTLDESNIQATLEKFSVRDNREGTDAEMRYMIGNADDSEANSADSKVEEDDAILGHDNGAIKEDSSSSTSDCKSALTMLVLDAKISPSLQMVSMRIQRPRLLVALDFLLAVAEFFIPSIHAMLSNGAGGNENPLEIQDGIFLHDAVHVQSTKDVVLSPKTPLIADEDGVDSYVYDGRGGTICLLDRKGANLRDFSQEVIIFIGDKKKLRFKNVVIQNGDYLDSCVSIGNNSSYSISENDGVFLEGRPEGANDNDSQRDSVGDTHEEDSVPTNQADKPPVELLFDLQAISPELTFYDSMSKPAESVLLPERLLRVRMNIFSRFVMKGDDMEVNAQVNGLSIEASSGLQVVEPVDMVVKFTNVSGKQKLNFAATQIHTNFSFSVLQLILRLEVDVMAFLRITSEQITVECSQFDKVWADDDEKSGANCITFWRPRPPPGFAILGDCLSPRDEPPSKGVIAVNTGLAHVKRPVKFVRVWSSDEVFSSASSGEISSDFDAESQCCSVWLPVPPQGYVALGCIASPGKSPPPLNTCFCILAPLATPCGLKDCIIINGRSKENLEEKKWPFWRVDNSTASFYLQSDFDLPPKFKPHELRHVISNYDSFPVQETKPAPTRKAPLEIQSPLQSSSSLDGVRPLQSVSSGRIFENVARFKLIWWDKNSGSSKGVSIWRPVASPGCVILGDVAVEGYEPPSIGVVLHDALERGLLSKPLRFLKGGQVTRRKGMGGVSFWIPVAPPGYVALGCIATSGSPPEEGDLVRCVRNDLVIGSRFSLSSLWKTSDIKHRKQDLSIWPVENEAMTFIVRQGFKHPPIRLALGLADLKKPNAPDNLVVDAQLKLISATIYDDFGGLMAPLVDLSIRDITVSVHGRVEAMSATVNFSLASTTFNGKCNAWEPVIETWDGRVRFDYLSDPSNQATPTVSKVRLTSSSAVNFNISTASLNMLFEAYASWNRLNKLEESSKKQFSMNSRGRLNSKAMSNIKNQNNLSSVNHNELGEEFFLRVVQNNQAKVMSLPANGTVVVKLPTVQRKHEIMAPGERKKNSTKIVALRIGDAEVPKDEGIGGREYMLAVRIIPQEEVSNQQEVQYQSARTRCVPPEDGPSPSLVTVHWDEVFIFEIEPNGGNTAEIMVTDLSKGTAVGFCSLELVEDAEHSSSVSPEKKIGGHIPWHLLTLESESLYRPDSSEGEESKDNDIKEPCGKVNLARHFFSLSEDPTKENEYDGSGHERGTFQIGPTQQGPWSPVALNYALGPAPWTINDDVIASEFYVDAGVKHVIMRSLVGLQNGTDFALNVSLCMVHSPKGKGSGEEMANSYAVGELYNEEVFENERYQPIAGWGSKWPGHLLPTDPAHYSLRDLTNPSKTFPDVKLPIGWEWTSGWRVDKADGVDEEGWGYALDFHNMQWPPSQNAEKGHSLVRRRCWVRSRESSSKGGSRVDLGVVAAGEKLSLPIACLRETSVNYCLQIRPTTNSHGVPCQWSQVIPYKGFREGSKQKGLKEIIVRSLVETEELLCCTTESTSTMQPKDIWFCLEATSEDIGKDVEMDPIKEWKLTITASIMLRNYLPVPCEYSVSEKSTERRLIVRDRGVINSGESAGIFHADLRKPIYLTWIPQGSWNPKKETILIHHPYKEPADHITYSNVKTGRALRVLIEQDHEEKGVAAKVLQFYVPCWLDSAKCPPLQYRILEILDLKISTEEMESGKVPHDGVKVGKITEHITFEEKDEFPTMLSDMDIKTMGMAVAINRGIHVQFGPVSPLVPLDYPDGHLELTGLTEHGSLYKFLVTTAACPLQFAKSKVICIRPYILFTNRLGEDLDLKQKEVEDYNTLKSSDWRVSFSFPAANEPELFQIKLEGHEWSYPFVIEKETTMVIPLRSKAGQRRYVNVDIRGYEDGSRFSVTFRLGSTRGPYRLENRTGLSQLKFRQVGLEDVDWQMLQPHHSKTFAWDHPQGEALLEVVAMHGDASDSVKYEIDTIGDHPELLLSSDLTPNVSVRVVEVLDIKTVRFFNTITDDLSDISEDDEIEASEAESVNHPLGLEDPSAVENGAMQTTEGQDIPEPVSSSEIEIVINIGQLGLSVTDQHPREILYFSLDNVMISYQIGFADGTSRFKLRVGHLQLDNQLPLSVMPVLLAPEKRDESKEFLLKFSLTMCAEKAEKAQIYPYVGLQVESAFRINVHEPIIWALMEMYNSLHLDQLSEDTEVVQVDPEIRIDLIDLSEVRLKLTLETASAGRPRGMLGIWGPLVTTIGNTNKMPIKIGSVVRQNRYMRKSAVSSAIVTRVRRDLIHQPLQLLSGVDVFGMASSTLGTLSHGAAELSNDGKYLRMRSKKDQSRTVGGVGDGLLQGTEALVRGIGYGFSGVVTKPISSARDNGFFGFFQGVGKAAISFVMLPVSGILDFVSLTVNGVGVSCTRCFELFENDYKVTRRRLPRSMHGGGILFPYFPNEAAGQAILQLAQSRSFYFKGVFLEPAKFAWSDFYENHFELPRSKILMLTNRRVISLKRPKSHFQNEDNTYTDPTLIGWQLPWRNVLYVEIAAREPCLLIHLRKNNKVVAHVVRCQSGNAEAGISHLHQVYEAMQQLWKKYGADRKSLISEAASKSRRHHSSRLSLKSKPERSQRLDSGKDEGYQERMLKLSNSKGGRSFGSSLTKEVVLFDQIWTSEQDAGGSCCGASSSQELCTIWRPVTPEGYVSVGDVARIGSESPPVSISYKFESNYFAMPLGYSLVWRNWKDGFVMPLTIWLPKPPDGYLAVGCVAVSDYMEPEAGSVWCVREDLTEATTLEEEVWHAPNSSPWHCFVYPIACEALAFFATREQMQESSRRFRKVRLPSTSE